MNPTAPIPASGPRTRLALDLRSLAVLRAGLAGLLLLDALCRLFAAGLLYSDAGLLPREFAVAALQGAQWSLHLANGSLVFAVLLALLQVLAAAALAAGWRARIAGPLLWLLVVSASARNPAVTSASDALALMLLSLGLVLPWNARWSVDSALSPQRPAPAFFSWPGLILLASVCALPLWPAIAADSAHGLSGLLSSEAAGPIAAWLLPVPTALPVIQGVLGVAAWLILPLVLLAALIPLARRLALALSLLLCLAALLLLGIGALPWLGLVATALLIDTALWERLDAASAPGELRMHPDRRAGGAVGLSLLLREFLCLPGAQMIPAQDSPRAARLIAGGAALVVIDRDEQAHLDGAAVAVLLRRSPLLRPLRVLFAGRAGDLLGGALLRLHRLAGPLARLGPGALRQRPIGRAASLVCLALALLLALVSLGAAGALPAPVTAVARTVLRPLALDRAWLELLPAADAGRSWIAVPGETREGREVDARSARLSPPDYGPARRPWFAGEHGRQYERALAHPQAGAARLALARYLCAQHPAELARLRITLMVSEAGAQTVEQRVLLRHECDGQ